MKYWNRLFKIFFLGAFFACGGVIWAESEQAEAQSAADSQQEQAAAAPIQPVADSPAPKEEVTAPPPRDPSKQPTRKDLFEYIWNFIIVGDGEATNDDLKNIAAFYTSLPREVQLRIEETHASRGLSDPQKREAIREVMPNVRYGTLVTNRGKTFQGVIVLYQDSYMDGERVDFHSRQFEISLTKGGTTSVFWEEVVEIAIDEETTIRTNRDKTLRGAIEDYQIMIFQDDSEPVRLVQEEVRMIAFGRLRRVQCPECFQKMEIDWKYCPFDGVKLR